MALCSTGGDPFRWESPVVPLLGKYLCQSRKLYVMFSLSPTLFALPLCTPYLLISSASSSPPVAKTLFQLLYGHTNTTNLLRGTMEGSDRGYDGLLSGGWYPPPTILWMLSQSLTLVRLSSSSSTEIAPLQSGMEESFRSLCKQTQRDTFQSIKLVVKFIILHA